MNTFTPLLLTEFCTSWCIPSQVMRPILKKLGKQYKNKVMIQIINIDQIRTAWKEYKIQGCPTFILFKGDVELERCVGAQSESQLQEMIERHL